MPVFEYKGYNQKGRKTKGIIDAGSRSVVLVRLKAKGIYPVEMKEIASESMDGSRFRSIFQFSFTRVKKTDVTLITRQLATLLSAGFPLVEAVSSLVTQTGSRSLQRVLSKIKEAVEEGQSFAQALSLYPSIFSDVYINMVQAGESSGTLEIVLERLADMLENQEEAGKKIQASLAYPIFMAVIGFLVILILLTKVVPGIIGIFSDMNRTLPTPTIWLITISSFMKTFWWVILAIPFLLTWGMHFMKKTPRGAFIFDRGLLNIPKIGQLIRKSSTARFARVLGSLLENGVPMLTALDIAKTTAGNRVLLDVVEKASQDVEQGRDLGVALEKYNIFPSLAVEMIRVGEKSGKLEQMLVKTADFYEKEVTGTVTALTSLLEPMIILFMGLVVGFIVLAVCLPIFDINQLVG